MTFKIIESDIEVLGQVVVSVLDGFKYFKELPGRILLEEGIGKPNGQGGVIINPTSWYPIKPWLCVFARIREDIGTNSLFKIGTRIPENAKFPPWVKDIESGIRAIDVAYHMNHRKGGLVMFNEQTGELIEGIGHYHQKKLPGKNEIIAECNNPYPCEFDRGILYAMAHKFQKRVFVTHDDHLPCRNKGGDVCTYHISW